MARLAASIAVTLAVVGIAPARADFSRLQWQYECLRDPDAVCFDATPSGADPLAPKAPPANAAPAAENATPASSSTSAATPPAGQSRKPAVKPPTEEAASGDPLRAVAARLQARKPTASDITLLQARAKAGNARALELLAWAELVGVGVPRDAVQAYFLYGMAAAAGVPTGRRDQATVYESALTAEERQQVLVIENGNIEQRAGAREPH